MADQIRDSQIVRLAVSGDDDSEIRDSQVVRLTIVEEPQELRDSQVVRLVVVEEPKQILDSQVVRLVVAEFPEQEETEFDDDPEIGLHWIHWFDALGTEYVWSKVDLPDPDHYYHGFKEARVIRWGTIKRALSDYRGEYEGSTFSWIQADTDRLLRSKLGDVATRVFMGTNAILRSIPDALRRVFGIPRTIVRGIVRGYKPISPLHFEFTAQDYFSAKFTVGSEEQQIPKRTITAADFPNASRDVVDQPVPVIYGELSDFGSATAPPTIGGDPSTGFFFEGPFPNAGVGAITSGAAVPTGVSVGTSGGGTVSASVPGSTYGVLVTSVDSLGVESASTPVFAGQANGGGVGSFAPGVPTVVVSGTDQIDVSWTLGAGAVKSRVYLGINYYEPRWLQVIEVDAPTASCSFTTNPAFGDPLSPGNITPAASLVSWDQFWWYSVSAIMPDGETGRSVEVFGRSHPMQYRPIRIEWLAVPSAISYRVYRRGAVGGWDRYWSVTAPTIAFDDDMKNTGAILLPTGAPAASGVVPVIHVGQSEDALGGAWETFLVCGHAVKEIPAWYSGGVLVDAGTAGSTWLIPGQAGWSTFFPNTGSPQYADINGHRYCLIYVRGSDAAAALDGSRPITLNVSGIEDVGDGTGDLIESIPLQYRHALQNWLVGDYQSGAWLPSPPVPDDPTLLQIDDDSFDDVDDILQDRIGGGYVGAFMLGGRGERVSLRSTMSRFHLSGDFDGGFSRRTQFFITAHSDDETILDTAPEFTQATEIIAGSFSTGDDYNQWANRYPYTFDRDYRTSSTTEWRSAATLQDDDSIEDYNGETRTASTINFHMIRSSAIAADIIARRLQRTADPPRLTIFRAGMSALNVELGDVILVTHGEGIGIAGYVQQPHRVVRHEFNPDDYSVLLECYDVARIFDA